MKSFAELQQTKLQLEAALEDINLALESDEYKKPFSFQLQNPLLPKDFTHQSIKNILERTSERSLGFDPNLTLQHIESEMLDQFNDIVKKEVKGKSVEQLLAMRHELELFMLTDRQKQHSHNLGLINKELVDLEKKIQESMDQDEKDVLKKNTVAQIKPEVADKKKK